MALKRITLAFISTILVIMLPVSMLLYSIENTMLKPQFWENELDRMHAYDTLKTMFAERLGGSAEVLPDTWLREQSHSIIENLLGYIASEKSTLNLTISTKGLKEGARAELYKQAETGVDKQIEALNYKPEYKEQARAQMLTEAKTMIDDKLNALPESANIAEGMDTSAIGQARTYITKGLAVTKALQVTSILLLLFGIALAGNAHGIAKWLAPILILTGASLLQLPAMVPATLEKATAQANAPEAVKLLMADLFGEIMAKTTPQGAALSAAGILLFFYGRAGKEEEIKPEEKETKPEENPPEKTSRKKAK